MALNIAVPLSGCISPMPPIGIDCWDNIKMLVSPIGSESSGVSSLDSEEAKHLKSITSSPPQKPIAVKSDLKIFYNGRDILDLRSNLEPSYNWKFRYSHLPEKNNLAMFWANRSVYNRLGPNGLTPVYTLNKCDCCDFQITNDISNPYLMQASLNMSLTTSSITYSTANQMQNRQKYGFTSNYLQNQQQHQQQQHHQPPQQRYHQIAVQPPIKSHNNFSNISSGFNNYNCNSQNNDVMIPPIKCMSTTTTTTSAMIKQHNKTNQYDNNNIFKKANKQPNYYNNNQFNLPSHKLTNDYNNAAAAAASNTTTTNTTITGLLPIITSATLSNQSHMLISPCEPSLPQITNLRNNINSNNSNTTKFFNTTTNNEQLTNNLGYNNAAPSQNLLHSIPLINQAAAAVVRSNAQTNSLTANRNQHQINYQNQILNNNNNLNNNNKQIQNHAFNNISQLFNNSILSNNIGGNCDIKSSFPAAATGGNQMSSSSSSIKSAGTIANSIGNHSNNIDNNSSLQINGQFYGGAGMYKYF